jgi:hypothetical protein
VLKEVIDIYLVIADVAELSARSRRARRPGGRHGDWITGGLSPISATWSAAPWMR